MERVPLLQRIGVTDGFGSRRWPWSEHSSSGCVALCLMRTLGAPRRSAVRRLHGDTTAAIVVQELAELRGTPCSSSPSAAPVAAIGLWFLQRARVGGDPRRRESSVFCTGLLAPVVAAHTIGTVLACRQPLAGALRGARPVGRAPARRTDRTGARAAAARRGRLRTDRVPLRPSRQGTAERDLRAAGRNRPALGHPGSPPGRGAGSTGTASERFAGGALERRDAFLAAAVEVSSGPRKVDGSCARRRRRATSICRTSVPRTAAASPPTARRSPCGCQPTVELDRRSARRRA